MKKRIALLLVLAMVVSVLSNATNGSFRYVDISEVHAEGEKTGAAAVNIARNYIGPMTYISGGMDLSVGVDCSGFVCAVYRLLGIDLVSRGVRSTYDMMGKYASINATYISPATKADVRNGDLVITNGGGHVGIGTDEGHMIHQTNSTINAVREVDLNDYSSPIVCIIRIDFTKWGGTNASNLNIQIDQGNNNNATTPNVEDKDNPGSPYAVPSGDITFGSNSNSTMWLQTALNKLNNSGLTVDGSFGRLSETAVKDFQIKYGLEATGVVNGTTRDKIIEIYKLLNSITKVEVNGGMETGAEGDTFTLTTKVTPELSVVIPFTWESSNSEVAIVDQNGNVTLVGGGVVDIIAKLPNGMNGFIKVTVTSKPHYSEWHNGRWYGAGGSCTYEYVGSWKSNSRGYWFEDTSGWYPKNEWAKIEGDWYYFNSSGYNCRKGWTQVNGTWYYFKKDGKMASSEWIGGYWLSADGGWNYTGTAKWKQDNTGWWYEDSLGWYPKDETVKIDDKEYTFNSVGYWVQ